MEFYIYNILVLLLLWQISGLSGRHHGGPKPYGGEHDSEFESDKDDPNELEDHCIYFRMDHDTRQVDTMICPFGCCGSLEDQKCCEDPEKEKDDKGLVHGLLIFAGVMLVVALSCCVFGVYKHKMANLRKTSPGRNYQTTEPVLKPAKCAIFYTPGSGSEWAPSTKKPNTFPSYRDQSERKSPSRITSPTPPYESDPEPEPDLPPYSSPSPPPPYSFTTVSMPPSSTQLPGQ